MFTSKGNDVHLWHANMEDIYIDEQSILVLSEHEMSLLNKRKKHLLREHYLKSRVFLRKILSLYVQKKPECIQFYFNEYNKPFLSEQTSSIFFNLSHTKNQIVCAIASDFAIGVDVESIERSVSSLVANHYFHAEEQTYLNSLSELEKHFGFFNIWTRKEAVLKALGIGLSFPTQSFSVLPLSHARIALHDHQIDLHTMQLDQQHVVSVAALRNITNIILKNYHTEF